MSPISARHQAANAPVSVIGSTSLAQPSGPADKPTVTAGAIIRNLILAVFLVYCVLPAMWIIAGMTKDNGQIFSTFGLWFSYPFHFLENLADLVTYQDGLFVRWFGNSLIYAGAISFGSTMICALGGYAFSKYDFPAKQFIFNFILGTIMVPSTALVLPLFLMLNK